MPLTDVKIKNAKAKIKPDGTVTSKLYRMSDEKGLYLEVAPSGGKLWRLKYRFEGKQKLLALGAYNEPVGDIKVTNASPRDEETKLIEQQD